MPTPEQVVKEQGLVGEGEESTEDLQRPGQIIDPDPSCIPLKSRNYVLQQGMLEARIDPAVGLGAMDALDRAECNLVFYATAIVHDAEFTSHKVVGFQVRGSTRDASHNIEPNEVVLYDGLVVSVKDETGQIFSFSVNQMRNGDLYFTQIG